MRRLYVRGRVAVKRYCGSTRVWLNDRPYMVALIAFLIVVTPGFIRMEAAVNDAEAAAVAADRRADDADEDAETAKRATEQNAALIGCLTDYAAHLTGALQDRDVVGTLARGASVDLWRAIRDYVQNPAATPEAGQQQLVDSINSYLRALDAISTSADLNPYPDLAACLDGIGSEGAVFQLVAYQPHPRGRACLGKRVTVHGTRGGNIIHGTDGRDVIRSGKGIDLIVAGAGKDRICAGGGGDHVNAGRGYDRVRCGRGLDSSQQEERRRNCEF